jgi:hypothetical protein
MTRRARGGGAAPPAWLLALAAWSLAAAALLTFFSSRAARTPRALVRVLPLATPRVDWSVICGGDDGYLLSAARGCVRFPLTLIFDAVVRCDAAGAGALAVVARPPGGEPADLPSMRVRVRGGAPGDAPVDVPLAWAVRDEYERAAVGDGALTAAASAAVCGAAAGAAGAAAPQMLVDYGPARRWSAAVPLLVLAPPVARAAWRAAARAPPPPPHALAGAARAQFAMCTTVTHASPLLRLWVEYWSLLGVGAFYFYAVRAAGAPGVPLDTAPLARALRGARGGAALTIVPWDYAMWAPSAEDANYAQAPALNSCAARFASAHESLLFYDVDELLVLPRSAALADFAAGVRARAPGARAVVTRMAWAVLDATPADVAAARDAHRALRAQPRARPSPAAAAAAAAACAAWADGPPHPPARDDDAPWDAAATALEHACWALAGEASPSARPARAGAADDDDDAAAAAAARGGAARGDDDAAGAGARRSPRYTPPARPTPARLGTAPSRLSLRALARAPVARSAVLGSGREKYLILNASALAGPPRTLVNVHGAYALAERAVLRADPREAYHLHVLNGEDAGAQALRVAAFVFAVMTRERAGPSVWPGAAPLAMQLDTDFADGVARAVDARGRGGDEEA